MVFGRKGVVVGMAVFASALATQGCAPSVADGAKMVYATSHICPAEKVDVRLRSDIAPHTVLQGVTPPPGTSLDSVGDTYEISGCNKKVTMVCGHPIVGKHDDPFSADATEDEEDGMHLSLNTGYFAITRALSVDDNRVSSVVVCHPAATKTVQ